MPLFPNGGGGVASGSVGGPVTFANLPAASSATNQFWWVSDIGTNGVLMRSTGTKWKLVNGEATLASQGAPTNPIANSETITLQTLMPAGSINISDRFLFWTSGTKNGATDTCTMKVRVGTAGTTGDTAAVSQIIMSAANLEFGCAFDFKVITATTTQLLGASNSNGAQIGYSNSQSSAALGAVTISNISNALWLSLTLIAGGATNTIIGQDARIRWIQDLN